MFIKKNQHKQLTPEEELKRFVMSMYARTRDILQMLEVLLNAQGLITTEEQQEKQQPQAWKR